MVAFSAMSPLFIASDLGVGVGDVKCATLPLSLLDDCKVLMRRRRSLSVSIYALI